MQVFNSINYGINIITFVNKVNTTTTEIKIKNQNQKRQQNQILK